MKQCTCKMQKGMGMGDRIQKIANLTDAKTPSIGNLEVGSYESGKTQTGRGPWTKGLTAAKKTQYTETNDNVPDRGFSDVSVRKYEVGSYKKNPKAGNTPSEK
jgi:hypothetical protein